MIDLVEAGRLGGSSPKHKWTDEEREIIRRDYQQTRASRREIAAHLSVTEYAVAGQIQRMGIAKRTDRRPWTPKENEQLGELITRYSSIGVAKRMHRSVNSVVVRSKRLGYSSRARDGWYTKREVCEMLGVDHKWVQKRIDRGELKATYHNGRKPQQRGLAMWHIDKKDLRKFVIEHCLELNGRNVDLFDLVHLLVPSVWKSSKEDSR